MILDVVCVSLLQVEGFRKHVGLLQVVCNRGMKDRHWSQVTKVVGFHIRPDTTSDLSKVRACRLVKTVLPRPCKRFPSWSLPRTAMWLFDACVTWAPVQLIDLSLDEYLEPLSAISEAATREFRIEVGLQAMSSQWKALELQFKPYKATGTHALTGPCADDVRALIEDHEIRTRTMQGAIGARGGPERVHLSWLYPCALVPHMCATWVLPALYAVSCWAGARAGSPYAEPFRSRLELHLKFLTFMLDLLTTWVAVQSSWHFLGPCLFACAYPTMGYLSNPALAHAIVSLVLCGDVCSCLRAYFLVA